MAGDEVNPRLLAIADALMDKHCPAVKGVSNHWKLYPNAVKFRNDIVKALADETPKWAGSYTFGDHVQKTKGSSWRGKVAGWYTTSLTPVGICVESFYEPGSVQIYPASALAYWKPPTT